MTTTSHILIVGGGAFGINTALELRSRGHAVTLLEPGPVPHPDAASTDISKVIRMDYGRDEFYMEMMEESLALWRQWNEELGDTVFHETGVLYFTLDGMGPGDFEYESYQLLLKRGHGIERLNSDEIRKRYPAWNADIYPDGYINPQGGWSPSGRVVTVMAARARAAGVSIIEGARFTELIQDGSAVKGARTADGKEYFADTVVVCAGTWTSTLLPWLQNVIWSTAQPVMHFQVPAVELASYQPPLFPVWTADVGKTGWYGFPAQPDGTLKLANHGPGWPMDPTLPRIMPAETEAMFRKFLGESLSRLANAPRIFERLCFYSDTFDGDFWIDRDPERPGLVVSAGGSGHAFKFTPLIGKVTADVVEGKPNKYAHRFAWRERGEVTAEEARFVERK
ncbi:MAG TPA: FAD-dependent oxidoreductase [Anaerolineales bacterium]|nr:FAD-dependent oxidoreductase [Anaerolineales bacterium]HRQ93069.1 FAD-dependent oxidoreductase [Anaerolineales bacterium]